MRGENAKPRTTFMPHPPFLPLFDSTAAAAAAAAETTALDLGVIVVVGCFVFHVVLFVVVMFLVCFVFSSFYMCFVWLVFLLLSGMKYGSVNYDLSCRLGSVNCILSSKPGSVYYYLT